MRRALRAHVERRNAEAERGCSLPSRDASAGSEIVGETHGGRLASRGRPLRDAKVCVPRASANMGILDRRAQRHAVPRRDAFKCRASELQCRRHTTNSREVTGTSRDPASSLPAFPLNIPEETADSDDVPIFHKYSEMLQHKPWLAIASTIKMPVVQIKRKYFIPDRYEVILPRSFDRMHQPPEGCCAISLPHLDAGLRFPLPREVNDILTRLEVCPMQLSPNSISHILLFSIVMKYLDLPPTFDNFWSFYNITASKRSGETGWFYLTTRKDFRYLDDLKSNVGLWRDRFFFIRPPPSHSWNFCLDWRETKPKPKIYGEGLDSDLINYTTLFWYLPKVLLQEKVLKLAGLFPAPIPVKGSLESTIMLARIANKSRAKNGTLPPSVDRELARYAALQKGKGKENETTVPSYAIPDAPERPSAPTEQPSTLSRLEAKLAADRAAEPVSRQKFLTSQEVWQHTRDERSPPLRVAEMSGEKWVPDWKISKNSSILRTLAGQDSWEIYKAACLERDQIILAQTSHTSIEEHLAHNIAQVMVFSHNLSLQCSVWRHEKIAVDARALDHEMKILEQQTLIESLQSEMRSMAELTSELEATKQALEELRSTAYNDRKAAFESGREQGQYEGQAQYLQSSEHQALQAQTRYEGARDFLKSNTFKETVENQASEFMTEGFENVKANSKSLVGSC
ncbi:UNVERIFIED_CONTAM: hypothetical protein Sindi_2463000 [Sesamum indicum]